MKLFFNVFVLLFISLSFIFAESEYEKIQRKAAKKVVKKQILLKKNNNNCSLSKYCVNH